MSTIEPRRELSINQISEKRVTEFSSGSHFHRPLLVVSAITGIAAIALTILVYIHPFISVDASIERWVQSFNAGPLTPVFAFYRAIGGPFGPVGLAVVFAIVLLLNRPAWRLLVAGSLASGWYYLLSNLVIRARPSVPDVLRVTEHPGASSFPSGHMILFMFYATILMLCLGLKFLPRTWQPYGWAVAVVLVVIGGISRMYSGAHWPSDVLAGALIATCWLSFVVAIRWISDPVLTPRRRLVSGAPTEGGVAVRATSQ